MHTINKFILTSSLVTLTALQAVTYEYPSLYKDPRFMGMGGANIAVGGESSSLFHNPAGLSKLDRREGIEVDLINLNISFSENTLDLIDDLDSVDTSSSNQPLYDLLEKYQGSNNHLTINNYSSISYKHETIGWSIGLLPLSAQFNFKTHALGSPAGLLDISGYALSGLTAGISYDWNDELHLGLGMKVLQGKSMTASLTLTEVLNLTDSNVDTAAYLEDNYLKDFESQTFDFGLIYDLDKILPYSDYWHPAMGLSLLDIGDTILGEYGTIPMTVNLGFSVKPNFPLLSNWLIAVDYMDMLNAYDEDYDADMAKRWRVGLKADIVNNSWLQLSGSTGLYNASPTYGLQARFALLSLVYASYAEAIGAYADQELDRRHTLSVSIGW